MNRKVVCPARQRTTTSLDFSTPQLVKICLVAALSLAFLACGGGDSAPPAPPKPNAQAIPAPPSPPPPPAEPAAPAVTAPAPAKAKAQKPPKEGGDINYDGAANGQVVFRHSVHQAKYPCERCHPSPFEQLAHTAPITMKELYAGKWCAECHDGTTTFSTKACKNCHIKR